MMNDFIVITNIQYAMEDYGMSENSLHAEMLLQISNSCGGSSGCYQKMKGCDGEMTVYNCVNEYTNTRCGQFYPNCNTCVQY